MIQSKGYAAQTKAAPLTPFSFERRDPGPNDVIVQILFSGICHSDIHQVKDEWGGSIYPMVPGHEIVGRVTAVGSEVTRFKHRRPRRRRRHGRFLPRLRPLHRPGRSLLREGLRRHLQRQSLRSERSRRAATPTTSSSTQRYVHSISPKLEPKLAAVAPLLCAGITTYSPLKHWKVGPGSKVGIVGLGGLGHMGLKFAHSFGAEVTLFTTSAGKEADAKRLGADHVVISKDKEAMAAQKRQVRLPPRLRFRPPRPQRVPRAARASNGTICVVGLPDEPFSLRPSPPSPTAAASPAP